MSSIPPFIPRKSFMPPEAVSRQYVGFFTLLVGIVIVISLLFSGGSYALRLFQARALEGLQARLVTLTEKLDITTVQAMDVLDKKLSLVSLLLEEHKYPARLFSFLSNATLRDVRFTSFSYNGNEGNVSLATEALNYTALIKQIRVFRERPEIKEVTLSSVSLGTGGVVHTSIILILDQSLFVF